MTLILFLSACISGQNTTTTTEGTASNGLDINKGGTPIDELRPRPTSAQSISGYLLIQGTNLMFVFLELIRMVTILFVRLRLLQKVILSFMPLLQLEI